jgi:hypothetical protein
MVCGPYVAALAGGCGGSVTTLGGDDGGSGGSSGGSSSGVDTGSSGGTSSGSTSGGFGSSTGSGGFGSSTSGGGFGSSTSGGGFGSSTSGGGFGSSTSGGGFGSSTSGGGFGSSSGGGSGSSGGGYGFVAFEQCTGGNFCGGVSFDFFAAFYPTLPQPSCPVTTLGSCQYYACTTQTGVGAGTIRIAGGTIPAGTTVTPDPSNFNNYFYNTTSALFQAGQTLAMSAAGGVVPPFGASVVAPGVTSLIAPPAPATNMSYSIPTSGDLVVQWAPVYTPAGVQMLFSAGLSTANGTYFQCAWDASLGKAIVPQSMLTKLSGQMGGYLIYGLNTTNFVNPGGYAVAVSALQYSGAMANFLP